MAKKAVVSSCKQTREQNHHVSEHNAHTDKELAGMLIYAHTCKDEM